jgi:hypothetical protein
MKVPHVPPIGAQSEQICGADVRVCPVGSTAGGGWTSRIPTPGGAMESDRRVQGARG